MDSKLIDAVVLRRKVHQEICRMNTHQPLSQYEKGFIDALARTEALIDKMQPVDRVIETQINMTQTGENITHIENCGTLYIK